METKSDQEILDELKRRFERNQKTLTEQARLLKELERVNNKLVESEKLKSQFLSNIRNEINNPLTSILGLAHTISNGQHEEADLKRVSQLIHQEAFILDFQLRNIFIAAELESGLLFPETTRVDIEQLVNQVVKEFSHLIKKKEIELNVEVSLLEASFYCDAEKIHLVLINLLSNAIEYSHLRGKLNLAISTDGEKLTAVIQDYGLGISADDHEVIFDRFKQLDAGTTKTHQGHGLGLSVTHELVDMLGGTIAIESELNKGCRFTVQFPRFEQPENIDATFGGSEFLFEAGEELF
jgi:signal transduction histidine kinase